MRTRLLAVAFDLLAAALIAGSGDSTALLHMFGVGDGRMGGGVVRRVMEVIVVEGMDEGVGVERTGGSHGQGYRESFMSVRERWCGGRWQKRRGRKRQRNEDGERERGSEWRSVNIRHK